MKFLIFSVSIGLFFASNLNAFIFDRSWEMIPEEWLQVMYPVTGEAPGRQSCDDITFNKCQADFDTNLNFTNTLTWRNSDILWVKIRQMLRFGSVSTFLQVCRARDSFQACMLDNYFPCLNRYSLMNRSNATWYLVMTYIRLFEHLDFLCNQGFDQLANLATWTCVQQATNTTANELCDVKFNSTLGGNYNNLCPAVTQYCDCKSKVYHASCHSPIGYMACEDIRVGYAADCRGIRCLVDNDN
uniref:Uncharacterized protein n=1 Tax=Acrobeloides nanus TaxID=290746 RepID=A0A914E0U0_9BILA